LESSPEIVRELVKAHNHTPAGFMGDADDRVPVAAFLFSELARFILGQKIGIDGGEHGSIF